jgi:hypothetical protein
MPDPFDRLLSEALAPSDRPPDRAFVIRVQARIALEERLEAQRRSLASGLAKQLLALGAVAAGFWLLGRSAPVASWFAESPAVGLAVLLTAFGFLAGLLAFGSSTAVRSRAPF